MEDKNKSQNKALSISDLVNLPILELIELFEKIELSPQEEKATQRLLVEIKSRLQFLCDAGVGYLTLNRNSNTLSGGESQRISLSKSIGSALVGSLYVIDEPSVGLHSHDTQKLIEILRKLRDIGNTVVVVEHDLDIIKSADHLIDIGPDAGINGGEVVYTGRIKDAKKEDIKKSHTLQYITGVEKIEVPTQRRKWNNFIEIKGANINNLKNISVKFPLNILTVVTGVSGSGKSSLVRDVLYKELNKFFNSGQRKNDNLYGSTHLIHSVEFLTQSPIGKSSRSNPVTYIKAYDEIRKLFSEVPMAKHMGYTPTHFSFNQPIGRCETCKGEGTINVPMQFMSDVVLTCEDCNGKRFKKDILDIKYRGKNINDILEMSIDQAIDFFSAKKDSLEKKIIDKLSYLSDVGLGYVKLGQSSSTLSGGENQRVKLASFLSNENLKPMIFIFDEPSTGLHIHDIKKLMKSINSLISNGHTAIIIEHNIDIIKQADYVIDLGVEGGDKGGYLVATGTPEEIAKNKSSITGKFLK